MSKKGTVDIMGVSWKWRIASPHTIRRKLGDDPHLEVDGYTDTTARLITISSEKLNEETIRHELFHAYIATLPFFNQGICKSFDDYEEMVCDLVGSHAPLIVSQASAILKECKE